MPGPYAIITFRDTGPIKTWSAMRAANVHNARTKPIAHGIANGPAPIFLLGSNDLVRDARDRLRHLDIDPNRLRKNGVIAYEAVLTASPEFFDGGDAAAQEKRVDEWAKAQVAWSVKRYGNHRIISMVLHLDEKTPHIHLVVMPLEPKCDRRRKNREIEWSLIGRSISGPGRFDEVQDDYAEAMAPFGLQRGVRKSGRKHEPVSVYLARLAAKERALDCDRKKLFAEQETVAADRAQLALDRASLDADHRQQYQTHQQERASLTTERADMTNRKRQLEEYAEALADARMQIVAERDLVEAKANELATFAAQIRTARGYIEKAVSEAADFERKAALVPPTSLTPAVLAARSAARNVIDAAASVAKYQQAVRPGMLPHGYVR